MKSDSAKDFVKILSHILQEKKSCKVNRILTQPTNGSVSIFKEMQTSAHF